MQSIGPAVGTGVLPCYDLPLVTEEDIPPIPFPSNIQQDQSHDIPSTVLPPNST